MLKQIRLRIRIRLPIQCSKNGLFFYLWAYYLGALNKSVFFYWNIIFLVILVNFFVNCLWFWLKICYPDPYPGGNPGGWNETDPHGSGSATRVIINVKDLTCRRYERSCRLERERVVLFLIPLHEDVMSSSLSKTQ